MRAFVVIVGVVLNICGLIGFGYVTITTESTNAIIGWVSRFNSHYTRSIFSR